MIIVYQIMSGMKRMKESNYCLLFLFFFPVNRQKKGARDDSRSEQRTYFTQGEFNQEIIPPLPGDTANAGSLLNGKMLNNLMGKDSWDS